MTVKRADSNTTGESFVALLKKISANDRNQ
jgi:hypothetical protein